MLNRRSFFKTTACYIASIFGFGKIKSIVGDPEAAIHKTESNTICFASTSREDAEKISLFCFHNFPNNLSKEDVDSDNHIIGYTLEDIKKDEWGWINLSNA